MAIKDALLPEFDHEMATARKVIERVPDGKFGYKPHDKSMTMGRLASHIAEMPNWAGPYLPKDVPMDPWGRPYEYKYPGEHGEDPDIISLGADGQPGGDGNNADIVSWSNK